MTRLTLSTASPSAAKADAVVIGLREGQDGPVAADAAFASVVDALVLAGANGKPGTITTIPGASMVGADRIIAVGLGSTPPGDVPSKIFDQETII